MHRPRPTEVQAWIADYDPLAITALVDPLVERYGFDARSPYAETYWLGVVGPSAMWALRRLTAWLAAEPAGFELPLGPLGRELGLGVGVGRHAPLVRSLARLVVFDLARITDVALAVRCTVPPLAQRHLTRLPAHLVDLHPAAHVNGARGSELATVEPHA